MILSEFMSECSVASVVDGQEEHFPAAGIHFTGDSWKLLVITGKYWRLLESTGDLLEITGISQIVTIQRPCHILLHHPKEPIKGLGKQDWLQGLNGGM